MERLRCFIAIDLPETLKEAMAGVQKSFRRWPARVKWVERQNFHLTLKFLGDVAGPRLADVEAGLARAVSEHREFEITATGLGVFPNPGHPKVIWAGISDSEGALAALWRSIELELAGRGFAREEKRFSPHLTLGRVKDPHPAPGLAELLEKIELGPVIVPVTEVRLMSSRLSQAGPEYSCLRAFTLR